MSPTRIPTRTLLLVLAILTAQAQTKVGTASTATQAATPAATPHKPRPKSPASPYNPNLILLDPAHGGTDSGSTLAQDILEKDVTLAFAGRLKTILAAQGFTVLLTHESSSDQLTPDQRAELANRTRAVACVLLHASPAGHGIHLFNSSLTAPAVSTPDPDEPRPILPWDTAQATALPQSTRLATALSDAFYAVRLPLVVGHAAVPPIDALTCPAVAVEISPLNASTSVSDPTYQQHAAEAITAALTNWRAHILAEAAAANPNQPPAPAAKPAITPPAAHKTKPVLIPEETPTTLTPDAPAPAPIIRRPPEPAGPPQ